MQPVLERLRVWGTSNAVTSTKLMLEAEQRNEQPGDALPAHLHHLAPLVDAAQLEPLVLSCLRSGMKRFTTDGEVKLTVLVTWDKTSFDIWSHLVPLPPLPAPPIHVLVKGAPRSNAAAKDSEWVRARKVLEDSMPADVNEIVLCDQGGELLEGMSSNFFAVTNDGTLVTADEGVLPGTVREVLLQVCETAGIPVQLRPPTLGEVDQWEGALVSSTSRLALPIDRLTIPAAAGAAAVGKERVVQFGESPVTRRIASLVQDAIAANSTPVFES